MPRLYTGDIEGAFWMGIQPSDDPTFFGRDPECIFKNDNDEIPDQLEYEFEFSDLPKIQKGIDITKALLYDHHDQLEEILSRPAYSVGFVAEELKVGEDVAKMLVKNWARLKLGEQILDCVIKNGSCSFIADLNS